MNQIFVYGTLKCGGGNHRYIEGKFSHCRPAAAKGLLFDLGPFPAAWFKGEPFLYGEVFAFEDVKSVLPSLDRLEGCPTLYRRIRVSLFDPETLEPDGTQAWAYEYHRKLADNQLIPSGIWEISR
ncbi:MAG: gamma-glutamylcyclotransferase [Planctomycetaceae bacterium]|jgi:gamma-glutamylcyclotransferase (GGCT)/AIG2-like uncharacterized protein YtfP|nr:gamma-glutamylcyclotransferase [Planctomycetaceae bacterium]